MPSKPQRLADDSSYLLAAIQLNPGGRRSGPRPPRKSGAAAGYRRQARAPRQVDQVTFARATARVDFAVLEKRGEAIVEDSSQQLARLSAKALKRSLPLEKVAELVAEPERIGNFGFDGVDVGKIKAGFKDALARAWANGTDSAARELGKAHGPAATFVQNLRNKAAEYFEGNGFRMAANLTDGMRAIIQGELLAAVKSGTRPEEVVFRILDRLIRKGFTTLSAVALEEPRQDVLSAVEALLGDALGTANVPAYLNTLVRTNTFEALNEARLAFFEDPDLKDFVVAYEYSAVLDSSTTEICTELDDAIYASSNPVWDSYKPPNHWNCRSLLVPIFVTDGWDGVETEPPTVQPQEGFK